MLVASQTLVSICTGHSIRITSERGVVGSESGAGKSGGASRRVGGSSRAWEGVGGLTRFRSIAGWGGVASACPAIETSLKVIGGEAQNDLRSCEGHGRGAFVARQTIETVAH